MKPLIFILSLITALVAGCSAETIVGPGDDGRALEPARVCNPNVRLC